MINYDGRRFRKPGSDTIALYHQENDVVWVEFAGGPVRRGSITGSCRPDGTLHMGYTMVLADGDVICGRTVNTPEIGVDGRITLREAWERYGPHAATGISHIVEVTDQP
ncbi:hypothetical protein [Kutzneria buriramensis]|uniref:Uncharacterized protein n=1 Tax=Kutzneria buriramensis TaxID=1045776 RepID=A0A3E0HI06_9PSEU|nr:hypothetical protein [Kutzneria buriramensis]REH46022.1 hypothetical protein BCF44_107154 [Kutzneria buriramensis]